MGEKRKRKEELGKDIERCVVEQSLYTVNMDYTHWLIREMAGQ